MTKQDLKNRMVVPNKDSITQFEPFYQILPKELTELNKQYHNEQLKLCNVIHWVACKDALPKHQTDVITYSKEFEVRNGRCMQGGTWFVNGYSKIVDVTHWAELPKPPCL